MKQYFSKFHQFNWNYLSFYKWLIFNICCFSLVGIAAATGLINILITGDRSGLVFVIFIVFLYGLISSGIKTFKISRELNWVLNKENKGKHLEFIKKVQSKEGSQHTSLSTALQLNIFGKISYIKSIASSLVVLGLIGTVLGFIIAFAGLPSAGIVNAAQANQLMTVLIKGLGTALFTTLLGSVLNLWLTVCFQILMSGTSNLIAKILETDIDV